jgi:hypothetical protein
MLSFIGRSILVGVITGVVVGVIAAFLLPIVGFSEPGLSFVVGAVGGAVAPWVSGSGERAVRARQTH